MKLPKLSCHKSCGLGYATWHGKEIYFGCCPRAKRRQSPSGKPMGLSSRSRSAERSPTPKRWPKLRSANAAQFFFIGPNRNLEQRSARATVPSPCPSFVCLAKRRPATLDRSSCAEFSGGLSSPPIESKRKVEGKIRSGRIPRTRSGIISPSTGFVGPADSEVTRRFNLERHVRRAQDAANMVEGK